MGRPAAKRAYLATSFRFAGYDNRDYYVPFYTQLKHALDAWFAQHAAALGGVTSAAYTTLRAQYAFVNPSPAVTHDEQVDHDHLIASLRMLP